MAVSKKAPLIKRTVGHSTGLTIGAAVDAQLDVVAGFKAARNPALVATWRLVTLSW